MAVELSDRLAKSGRRVPDLAFAGGFSAEDHVFKALALGAPYCKAVCMGRALMIPGMVGKNTERWLRDEDGGLPSTVTKYGFTKEEIFMNYEVLKEKYGSEVEDIPLGGKVLTLSDSSGYIYDPEGIDSKKLVFVKRLKNLKRGRIREYVDKYSETIYTEADTSLDYNPLWSHRGDCAFPCAVENEIREKDAYNLINNDTKLICEGADMPASPEAVRIFQDKKLLYAPGKAANAGGVAVSCLETAQNRMLLNWSAEEVDQRLRTVVKNIHRSCLDVAAEYGEPGNYLAGANIAGFVRVVDAMLVQGLV
jgi:hypothetical protein